MRYTLCLALTLLAISASSQITINTSFEANISSPLDLRAKINTLADTATIPFVYDGHIAYIVSEDAVYYKGSVKWVEIGGSTLWATIVGIPTDIADGDDDSQLSQAEVNAFETDPIYSAWDKDYNDLTNLPIIPTNNNQLTNGAGYITSPNDADFDPNNEIQDTNEIVGLLDFVQNNSIADGIGTDTSGNYHISIDNDLDSTNELQGFDVHSFGLDNILKLSLSDNTTTHFIDLSSLDDSGTDDQMIDIVSDWLMIENGNSVDLEPYLDNTDTQLSEAQVDAYADNNGYLETEVDGSISNELQTLTDNGATFTLSNGGGSVTKTVDTDTQLTEAQVDAFADNNGYLETEVDGSITNEIQTISKVGQTVTLSNSGGSFTDDVNDADFDPTNEIQDTTNIVGLLEFVQNNGGSSGGKFVDGTDPLDAVYMDGYVGIGTNTPDERLEIRAETIDSNPFKMSGASNETRGFSIGFEGSTENDIVFNRVLSDVPNTFMRVERSAIGDISFPSGNIGIGTNTPSATLDVVGDLEVNGKAAIGTSGLSPYADLIIGNGYIDFANTSKSVFIGEDAGANNIQASNIGVGFEALMNGTAGTSTAIGYRAGKNNTGGSLLAIGHLAGQSNTGINNTFIGYLAGLGNTSGRFNVFIGSSAGVSNTTGEKSVIIGYDAGDGDTDIDRSVVIGNEAGSVSVGDFSTVVGSFAGKTSGIGNSCFGYNSGAIAAGDYGVYLGFNAGSLETGSNKLYIDNSNTTTPLIYGDFATDELTVNGELHVSDRIGGAATKSAAFDANGQLVEVDLTTADGKFVDGTDPLDAVYSDGNVGIGNTNPQAKLHIDGQTILTNTNGTDGASLFLGRSGNVSQAAEINFVENSSATFSYGFRFRLDGIGNKLYLESNNATTGSPSLFDLMAFNRAGGVEVENSLAMNGVFTQEFPKDSGLANTNFGIDNLAAITSGNYNFSAGQGNFKSSTSLNYTFSNGLDNFKNMTTPSSYLFVNGLQNFPSATDADYSFINGFRNGYVGTATLNYATISGHSNYYNTNSGIYGSTAFGLNNAYSNTGNSYYEFYNGAYNAQDATSVGYNFMSGYRNAADASSITYSFLAGDRNLSTTTADMTHNFMVGRNNAEKALDSDYSFAVGYFNAANSTTADLDYTFLSGYQNAYVGGNMESAFIHGFRNGYNCTGSLKRSIMIGYENGYGELANLHNSILLGYRQGYTDGTDAAGNYKLAIGMYQDQPLIFGDFVTEEVEITGSLAISDRIVGAATKNAAFDADGHIVETDLIATGYGGAETGLNTISSTAATQVLFNAVFGSDINTNTDITTGEDIEVTNAGIWEVSFSGNIGSYTADEILSVNILINGTLDRSVKIKAADVNSAIAYTYHLNLSANDAISLELDSTTDADYTYNDVRLILNRIN